MNKILGAPGIFLGAFLLSVSGVAEANAQSDRSEQQAEPAQLELCGAFVRVAPFCAESVEVDTRQLQAMQLIPVTLSASVGEEWQRIHRERRRGISYTTTNEQGETVRTGRPVQAAIARVIAIPPSGNTDEAMLYQALVSPDMSRVIALLPAEGNFQGWSMYIFSSEGKHALTLTGELVRVSGRHRDDGNLTPDITRLPASRVTSTTLVRRGDGSGAIEALEATFVDHTLVRDRDGSIRVYSGLAGTFTPVSPDGTTTVAMYTNCRTAGQRLIERGNLRVDTGSIVSAAATSGLTLVPQVFQNVLALFRTSCR